MDLIKLTENFEPGRITIRGDNGTGKSTLLMLLKKELASNAFYLPISSKLFFPNLLKKEASTGERLVLQLDNIKKEIDARVILLDEWDANLDNVNIEKISKMIDEISKTKCVIEVTHR